MTRFYKEEEAEDEDDDVGRYLKECVKGIQQITDHHENIIKASNLTPEQLSLLTIKDFENVFQPIRDIDLQKTLDCLNWLPNISQNLLQVAIPKLDPTTLTSLSASLDTLQATIKNHRPPKAVNVKPRGRKPKKQKTK